MNTNLPKPESLLGSARLDIPGVDLTRRLCDLSSDDLPAINELLYRSTGILILCEGFEAWHLDLPGWSYHATIDGFKADAVDSGTNTSWPVAAHLTVGQIIELALMLRHVVPDPSFLPPRPAHEQH